MAQLDTGFVAVPESLKSNPANRIGVIEIYMAETESALAENQGATPETEEITYQAVEKDGVVTAIWEMKGRKHLRTIDPRSRQGREILNLYTTEEVDHTATEAASS